MQKRVERGKAELLVEANSSGVEGGHAQAPHLDGKVLLTKDQPRVDERSPQAFARQIWPQSQSHLNGMARSVWFEDKKPDEVVLFVQDSLIGLLPALGGSSSSAKSSGSWSQS